MMHKKSFCTPGLALVGLCGLLLLSACTADKSGLKRVPEGQQFSGFLKDYDKLTVNAKLGGDALTFVTKDANNNLRHYVAIIVDRGVVAVPV